MEEYTAQQLKTGEEIQRVVINYKKDSADRKKSSKYFEDRLSVLESNWSQFEDRDTKIRALPNVNQQHEYFVRDYYSEIHEVVRKYSELFRANMSLLNHKASNQGQKESEASGSANVKSSTQGLDTPDNDNVSGIVRKQIRTIESLHRFLATIQRDNEQPKEYYEAKRGTLSRIWQQIESLNLSIWELSDDPVLHGYNASAYIQAEDAAEANLTNLSIRINGQSSNRAATPTMNNNVSIENSLNLPRITIPKFEGDYLKWRQFYDIFNQMIHNKPIPNIQKMWYLKTNVSGEAEKLIGHLSLTEENYLTAWQSLQDRYNNVRVLTSALIQRIIGQPNQSSDNVSASAIRELHDTTQEGLQALNNLGVDTCNWDPLLLHLIVKKLDKTTHVLYEQSLKNPRSNQSIKEFLNFLELRFQSLEAIGQGVSSPKNHSKSNSKACSSVVSTTEKKTNEKKFQNTCRACNTGGHPLYGCKQFLEWSIDKRSQFVHQQRLCINCLRFGHKAKACILRACNKCNKKHNTLLHHNDRTILQETEKPSSSKDKHELTTLTAFNDQSYVLLSTTLIKLTGKNGKCIECRAILDSGSQVNLITEGLMKKLGLSPNNTSMCIQGIGNGKRDVHHRVNVQLRSTINGFSAQLEAFVLKSIISPQPTQHLDTSSWAIPNNIPLADPNFNKPNKIDVLIGAEFYHQLLSIGQIKLGEGLPTLQNTVLGWILSGKVEMTKIGLATCGICSESEVDTNQIIEKFWKLEEAEIVEPRITSAEKQCEEHFTQTVSRGDYGRFIVRLPFAQNTAALGSSQEIALNRFLALERRLLKNDTVRTQYIEFMEEYETLGHMTEVNIDDILSPNYFIPHHCVLKPDSSSTKLRVVFDASTKTSSGTSLNDIMYSGPVIQNELFAILLRFRMPRFVFTTDIQKMYRQILVHEDDRKYQLIAWRKSPNDRLKYYQLNTVTYGTRSAPYLAIRCLHQLAKESNARYPLGAEALRNDFYVDDGLTGSNSLTTAKEIQRELIKTLDQAGLKLRKWCANHPQLLQDIPSEHQEVILDFNTKEEETIKTLGLSWLPKNDQFIFKTFIDTKSRITKRSVCSEIARIFDPLGILGPVIVTAKIFIQQLWQLKITWDEALPAELHTKWLSFQGSLRELTNINIPRHVFNSEVPRSFQIHAFADASEKAYGAAIYIRSILSDGRIIMRLLCSKSRVAPLKKQTLPRLELCAAVLSVILATRVRRELRAEDTKIHFWTDSEIVLNWINSNSSSFHTFVANRIATIQNLSVPDQWRHVRSKDNPADVLSRGLSPSQFKSCGMWLYGPLFLHGIEDSWSKPFRQTLAINTDEERKKKFSIAVTSSATENLLQRVNHRNSFKTLVHIIAFVQRFVNNCKENKLSRPKQLTLTPIELDEALMKIILMMQQTHFGNEIKDLKKYNELHKSSSLSSLSPFLDEIGIIRVGGRINSSSLSYDAKHQMLIPYDDPLTKLIMQEIHENNYHCGAQTLLAHTRQRFWPIKGKIISRSIVQHCIRCNKARPNFLKQMMGNLPATRVQPARPFLNSGVDYCGPFWIHYKIRGKRPLKAYVAIFCCFATKAVHIEIVSDLTTESFIGALNRFIGRRGICENLYCDNATNFTGARNQLAELSSAIYSSTASDKIITACNNKGIKFNFIPPRAPHFGGLWEASVKSAKHLLVRSVSTASLTYEELETVMIGIEAVLNSRPLTPMSEDPNDLTALTPGHLLIGQPLTAIPDVNTATLKASTLTRWKLVSHIKNEFWKRWSRDYLNELQFRHKWREQSPNIKPGGLVIIKEDNVPILQWPLGRITRVYKGDDGAVRVVDVKTSTGIWKRAIHRLAPLPISEEPEENHEEIEPIEDQSKGIQEPIEVPRKKIKHSSNTNLIIMLIAVLMLPIMAANPVQITRFKSEPGIHFEGIGTTRFVTAEWKIIAYYDLSALKNEILTFTNGTLALHNLCEQFTKRVACRQLVDHFNQTKTNLQFNNILLSEGRVKRGALNVVGNIANSLFGVLDSEYAEKMSSLIDKVKENEDYLLQLHKTQTSIIDSTVNIVKRSQINTNSKFTNLQSQIKMLMNGIQQTENEVELIQLFNSISIQMTMLISDLQRMQGAILDVITDTHNGKAHLLAAQQLPGNEDLLQLYKLMTIKGSITNDHVVFIISLPLIDHKTFDLFNMIPIPVIKNNTMLTVNPCTTFLSINTHRDQYVPISKDQLNECKTMKEGSYLCSNLLSKFNKGSELCSCSFDLFNNQTNPKCKLRELQNNFMLTPLYQKNQWIFATSSPIQMSAVCGTSFFQLKLEEAGLLHLEPGCTIKHNSVIIQAYYEYTSVLRPSYTSFGSMTDFSSAQKMNSPSNNSITIDQRFEGDELETLKILLKDQEFVKLPNRIKTSDYHHITIGYSALLISIGLACGFLWTWKRGYFNKNIKAENISVKLSHQNSPIYVPTPKQRNTIKTSEFAVHI